MNPHTASADINQFEIFLFQGNKKKKQFFTRFCFNKTYHFFFARMQHAQQQNIPLTCNVIVIW